MCDLPIQCSRHHSAAMQVWMVVLVCGQCLCVGSTLKACWYTWVGSSTSLVSNTTCFWHHCVSTTHTVHHNHNHRHMCMCKDCAQELAKQTSKCPICRNTIESLLHIKVQRRGRRSSSKKDSSKSLESSKEHSSSKGEQGGGTPAAPERQPSARHSHGGNPNPAGAGAASAVV